MTCAITLSVRVTPSSIRSDSGEPSDMPTSSTAATHGGRFEIASICSFSTKMVSVRSQLWERTVRSTSSELPTRLQSGWVLVTSGVFFQCSSWTSNMRTKVASAVAASGKG